MENISTENAEMDETVGRETSQYCLRFPTILRLILEHFSTTELIELSLVNKLWNFEARSVMREQGHLRANTTRRLDLPDDSCLKLAVFASDLEKMRVVPLTGLSILLFHCDGCKSVTDETLNSTYKIILDRLPFKHFSVRFCDADWDDCKGCPALLLVEKILSNYCGVLEELSLRRGKQEFLRTIFQSRSFPRLKILKIERKSWRTGREHWTNQFIKTLVSCAPNLQELHVEEESSFQENILEGSSAVLVHCRVFRPFFYQICESLIGSFRAETMELFLQDEDADPQLLNRFIPKLLEASRTSLKTLQIDLLFAVPLMCYGICLENVTTLELHMNCYSLDQLEPPILKLPTGLDFTRVFPKLTQVAILDGGKTEFSSDVISAFVEQGTELLDRALPDRAINIKHLDLEHCSTYIENATFPLLARMFPDVKTVHTHRDQEASFRNLREHFLCLEEATQTAYGRAY